MLYQIAKIICKFCIQVYYSKIEVQGLDTLPKDKPILLACNHPTGFLEPIIIACILKRNLHFITRGDLFSNKALGPILRGTNQIPIWRFKDGYAGLRKNNESIKAAKRALLSGGALLMFVEGKTEDIKMLKPLQKGLARISVSLVENGLEHMIIPVGINFVDTVSFRSRVMLNFGEAINPKPIIDEQKDDRKVFSEINDEISERMKSVMLHISDRGRHQFGNLLLNLYQATKQETFLPVIDKTRSRFDEMKCLTDWLNNASNEKVSNMESKFTKVDYVHSKGPVLRKPSKSFINYLKLLLISPFAFIGLLINILPILGGRFIESTLVKSREFIAPIRFSASMGLGLVWYISLLTILILNFKSYGILILLGIPLGLITLYFIHIYRNISPKYSVSNQSVERLVTIFTHLK